MADIRTGVGPSVTDITDQSGGSAADGTIEVVTLPTQITDSTTGTADATLEALPNLADTPLTADFLRDDLHNNAYPVLRNWAADLAARQAENRTALAALQHAITELSTKQNTILAALRQGGLIAT